MRQEWLSTGCSDCSRFLHTVADWIHTTRRDETRHATSNKNSNLKNPRWREKSITISQQRLEQFYFYWFCSFDLSPSKCSFKKYLLAVKVCACQCTSKQNNAEQQVVWRLYKPRHGSIRIQQCCWTPQSTKSIVMRSIQTIRAASCNVFIIDFYRPNVDYANYNIQSGRQLLCYAFWLPSPVSVTPQRPPFVYLPNDIIQLSRVFSWLLAVKKIGENQ